jgi:predicted P-loop ATPase
MTETKYKHVFNESKPGIYSMISEVFEEKEIRFRINKRIRKGEVRQGSNPWEPVSGSRLLSRVREEIGNDYGYQLSGGPVKPLRVPDSKWRTITEAALFDKDIDPFQAWLEKLPEWDQVHRIDGFLREVFMDHEGFPEFPLDHHTAVWSSRFLFVAPIQMVYLHSSRVAGDNINCSPLFIGVQAERMSIMLEALLPEEHPEWYSDKFIISEDDKTVSKSIWDKVIVRIPEMQGFNHATAEAYLRFSLQERDRVALQHRRKEEQVPRKCILVGTSTQARPLPYNVNGWNEICPIPLGHARVDVGKHIREYRLQLWSEAKFKFEQGTRCRIPHDYWGSGLLERSHKFMLRSLHRR